MNVISAIIAGLVGTLFMTVLMYKAPCMGMPKMDIMMKMHPRPPASDGSPMMVVGPLMGHMVFGLVTALTYGALI